MLIEMYPKDPRICFENEAMLRLGNMYLGEACLLSKPLALCKTLYELCQARINSEEAVIITFGESCPELRQIWPEQD